MTRLERDRQHFIKRCREQRQLALERLKLMQINARSDTDPDLRVAIEDMKHFISLIDLDLATAGQTLH